MGRQFAAPWCAHQQTGSQEKWLHFIGERVGRRVHGIGDRLDSGWASLEDAEYCLQVFAILGVEAKFINTEHLQGAVGNVQGDESVCPTGCIVANPTQPIVGDPRCTPT